MWEEKGKQEVKGKGEGKGKGEDAEAQTNMHSSAILNVNEVQMIFT